MTTKEYLRLRPGSIVYKFDPALRFKVPGRVESKRYLLIRADFGQGVDEYWYTELEVKNQEIQLLQQGE